MASKKRSVLFERNSTSNNAANNAANSDPEPSSRSGVFAVVPLGATQNTAQNAASTAATPAPPLDAKAIEALVTAHVLSRL